MAENQEGEEAMLYDEEDEIAVDEGLAELEQMKKKLAEMEAEAAALKALGGTAGGEAGASGAANAATTAQDAAAKEEVDGRSVFVGNVDYECTPEELQQHFNSCGTVNRVTILTDKFGNPKAFAYVEFLEVDAVSNAVLLDNTELHGRNVRVTPKRTNVPGMKQRGRGGRGRGGYGGPPPWAGGRGRGYGGYAPRGGYGGYAPRGGGRGRGQGRFYSPY